MGTVDSRPGGETLTVDHFADAAASSALQWNPVTMQTAPGALAERVPSARTPCDPIPSPGLYVTDFDRGGSLDPSQEIRDRVDQDVGLNPIGGTRQTPWHA